VRLSFVESHHCLSAYYCRYHVYGDVKGHVGGDANEYIMCHPVMIESVVCNRSVMCA